MLKEVLEKMEQSSHNHPISSDEYDSWKSSKVTKRLFADLDYSVISGLESITRHGTNEDIAKKAIEFSTSRENVESVKEWLPTELAGDDDA